MVLDIYIEGCDDSISCHYSGFEKFRCEILRGWNEELGKLYEQKYGFLWERKNEICSFSFLLIYNEAKSLDYRMRKILDEYDRPYNEGIKLFFYHSDCDGEFTPEECELLLKSFEHVNPEKFDNSDKQTNEWLRETYEIWINMIQNSINNNKSILFG